jgi:hypothetical protein
MEQAKKLRRYTSKDYNQLVEFPVEIVSRDGVVRHYSFEASVRLYQRRIASAMSRYPDQEVARAEVNHCRARIEQLRKSYLARYGWAGIRSQEGPVLQVGPLAGEVAAFLRRYFEEEENLDELQIIWVHDDEHYQMWWVKLNHAERSNLLYLFRFEHHGACEGREAFFAMLRLLRVAQGELVESVVAFHHTADCGLILSGTSTPNDALEQWKERVAIAEQEEQLEMMEAAERARQDPYTDALRMLSSGDSMGALKRLEDALTGGPFRRPVALATAVVAESVGAYDSCEAAGLIGVHYLPTDPVFHYYVGLARLRQGRADDASAALEMAARGGRLLFPVTILRALLRVRGGDLRGGAVLMGQARSEARSEDEELLAELRGLWVAVQGWSWFATAGALLGCVALGLFFAGTAAPVVIICAGITLAISLAMRLYAARFATLEALRTLQIPPPESLGGGQRIDDLVP